MRPLTTPRLLILLCVLCMAFPFSTTQPATARDSRVASTLATASAALARRTGVAPRTGSTTTSHPRTRAQRAAFATLPLSFERNEGQDRHDHLNLAHGQGYTAALTQSGLLLALTAPTKRTAQHTSSRCQHRSRGAAGWRRSTSYGAWPAAAPRPGQLLHWKQPQGLAYPHPDLWQVTYQGVYPGIDVVYHGQQQALAFDFPCTRCPGQRIRLHIGGMGSATQDAQGNLALTAGSTQAADGPCRGLPDVPRPTPAVGAHFQLLGGDDVGLRPRSLRRRPCR